MIQGLITFHSHKDLFIFNKKLGGLLLKMYTFLCYYFLNIPYKAKQREIIRHLSRNKTFNIVIAVIYLKVNECDENTAPFHCKVQSFNSCVLPSFSLPALLFSNIHIYTPYMRGKSHPLQIIEGARIFIPQN